MHIYDAQTVQLPKSDKTRTMTVKSTNVREHGATGTVGFNGKTLVVKWNANLLQWEPK